MSWLDEFFNSGYKTLENDGTALPQRSILDVQGATLTDVPSLKKTLFVVDPPVPPRFPFGPAAKLVTPPDVSAFTIVNPSPGWITEACHATIENHPSGYGVVIYGDHSSAHACFSGIFVPRAGITELIVQVAAPYWGGGFINTSTNSFGGLFVYDSASGKSTLMGPYVPPLSANISPQIAVFHQNVPGDSTAAVGNFSTVGNPLFPLWLRLFDDGTNYNFQFSTDGEWSVAPVYSEAKASFVPGGGDMIGIAIGQIVTSGTRANDRAASLWLGSWSAT
jgi:hypothetical protein